MYFVVSGTSSETTLEQNSSALNGDTFSQECLHNLSISHHIQVRIIAYMQVFTARFQGQFQYSTPQKNHLTLGIASVKS